MSFGNRDPCRCKEPLEVIWAKDEKGNEYYICMGCMGYVYGKGLNSKGDIN